jgi:phytoene dehydrogenase-like protein
MSTDTTFDAIVVGSGLGGLTAAAYLAALGRRTLVLERYDVLGGNSHVFRRKNRWEFDCGVHYIGDCGPDGQMPTLLRGLGLDDRIEFLPLDRDGFDTIVGPDLELRIPFGWDALEVNLVDAFPAEERAVRRWLRIMRRIGEGFERRQAVSTPRDAARLARRAGIAAAWIPAPSMALMIACGLSVRAAMALSAQAGALASTTQTLPVVVHAGFLQNYCERGAWYPRGGGQMLSAGLSEVVRSHGGQVRTKAHVERILVDGGRVRGVRLASGEELRAPVVVAAGDLIKTFRDLVGHEHLSPRAARRARRWTMGLPLLNTYVGVELDVSQTPNSNFFAIPNWEGARSLRGLGGWSSRMMGRDQRRDPARWARDVAANHTAFVQCSTRRDPDNPRSAPPGHAAIEIQTLVPATPTLWGIHDTELRTGSYRRNADYRELKEIVAEGMLDRMEQVFPGSRSTIRWSEFGSPATHERYTNTTDGAAFGLESRMGQTGPFRPDTRTEIEGLFLAGASTRWGPGTEGSMTSGLAAVSAIVGRDLDREIRAGAVLADPSRLSVWPEDFDPLQACRRLGTRPLTARQEETEEAEASAPLPVSARPGPAPATTEGLLAGRA